MDDNGQRGAGDSDVLVVGAGHNGLVAAILAAQAGWTVTLLERGSTVGGATVSTAVFAGHQARLSRYSYLVSLFPESLVRRLGVDLRLVSRAVASYTPVERRGRPDGLLVETRPGTATEESFRRITGGDDDHRAWTEFYAEVTTVAQLVAPALLGPLRRRSELRDAVVRGAGARVWDDLVEQPLGRTIESRFRDDTVRGVVGTDGLIGTHTSLFDESLLANRCFLYHVVGRGTGEWLVPVGGMGALTAQLVSRARELGVRTLVDAAVAGVEETADSVTAHVEGGGSYRARHLLAAVAPAVVDDWLGREAQRPIGAQLKINLLLSRLPALASGIDPRQAFAGTTHLEEGWEQLEQAYRSTSAGELPAVLPSEVYCHSLTDPSILGGGGGATMTVFGLHAAATLFDGRPSRRAEAVAATLAGLQRHLAEPLEDCLARDDQGRPCIDVATPRDLERSLGMPGGHIFHGDLTWPWLEDTDVPEGPADRFGVGVPGSRRILLAGAGTRRGGGVSGLGGAATVAALADGISDRIPAR